MKKKYVSLLLLAITVVIFAFSNTVSAQNIFEDNYKITRRYNGQEGYGSSGIVDCKKYLQHKYKGKVTKLSEKDLDLIKIPQAMFSEKKNEGNCALVAITRLVNYYSVNGYITITDKNVVDIYKTVKKLAVNKYNYTPNDGLMVMNIKPLIEDVFNHYNYKVNVEMNPIIWDFNEQIKNELDNNRPVILVNTIGFGYYNRHALAVSGYEIYNVNKKRLIRPNDKQYPMLEVNDGWSFGTRYIDYNKFKHELQNLTSTVITVSIRR